MPDITNDAVLFSRISELKREAELIIKAIRNLAEREKSTAFAFIHKEKTKEKAKNVAVNFLINLITHLK